MRWFFSEDREEKREIEEEKGRKRNKEREKNWKRGREKTTYKEERRNLHDR